MVRGLTVFGVICLVAIGPSAHGQDLLKVGKAQAKPFTFVPLDVGIEEGIFAMQGLTIEVTNFTGSARLHQGLAAGAVDIGLGAGPELAFLVKGSPELAVGVIENKPALPVLVVQKNGPILAIADLRNETVSVATAGSLASWLVAELVQRQGWNPGSIRTIELGADTAQAAALRIGQTSGMVTDLATAYRLEEEDTGRILVEFGDIVPNLDINIIYASAKLIGERSDLLRRFLAGWFEAVAYMRTHPAESVRIGARVGAVSETTERKVYERVMPALSSDGRFDPTALGVLQRSFVELGVLPTAPDMSKLYTEEYLPTH